MFLLPVAAREVREASRQPRTYAWRSATAGVAIVVMAFIAWVSNGGGLGRDLFVAVSTIAYIYCLIAGVVRTADTISEEKRENTLGLLFLTDLKGWDIILGKLLSSSVSCVCGLLALIPMLAIPMLMGGVQMIEFLRVILSLIVTLLLSISWGFLISSLFRLSVVTISTGLAIIILTAGALPLLAVLLAEEFHLRFLAVAVFVFSPTHCHMFAFDISAPGYLHHYWLAIAINSTIAFINLRLAIFFLPRFWQEVPKNKKTETWRNRIRALRFGKPKAKTRLRKRLLDHNPFYWLANREQVSSVGLMVTSVAILLIGLTAGIASARNAWRSVEQIMISWMMSLVVVHIIVAFRMAMSASYRLAEDRRSGALELLLATEVSIREVLRGYWMALGRQFFGPILIIIFAGAFGMSMMLMMFSSIMGGGAGNIWATLFEIYARMFRDFGDSEKGLIFTMILSIQLMIAIDWIALIWVGMWLGLREKRPGVATWVTLSLVFVPPWVILIAGMITIAEMRLTGGLTEEYAVTAVLIAGWILGGSNALLLSVWARRNLLNRFREAAADRYMGPRRIPWPKIRRIAIRFAVAGACFVFALYVARYVVNRRGEKAWAEARAAFPNFNLEKTTPERRSIPDAQNLAQAPFFRALTGPGGARKLITWNLSSVARGGYNGEPISWEWGQRRRMNLGLIEDTYIERKILKQTAETPAATVLAGLAEYDDRLEELREEARARPLLQFAVWTNPVPGEIFYPGYQGYNARSSDIRPAVRQLIQTLALRTSANLANKSATNGVEDILIALRLADGVKDIAQSTLQHHEMLLDIAQPVYDGLTLRAWKNDDLKKLQAHFAAIDLWTPFESYREGYLREILRDRDLAAMGFRGGQTSWLARQAPTGFYRKWQADTLRWGLTTLPKIAETKTHRVDPDALRNFHKNRPASPTSYRYPDEIGTGVRSLAYTQTTLDEIVLACALERFRNDRGALPQKLDELVPNYLAKIPHDVFTGLPLHFKLSADAKNYVIYSVASNGADDHGAPASMVGSWMLWQDQPSSDWVWNSESLDHPPVAPKRKRAGRK